MLQVYGYVVMPEHVHLLLSEAQRDAYGDHNFPLKPKDGLNGPPVTLLQRVVISAAASNITPMANAAQELAAR
jgi:hypothetical protein